MLELIALTGAIISSGKNLRENKAFAGAENGVFKWIGNAPGGKKSFEEKLDRLKTGEFTEEDFKSIQSNLEYVPEDNDELQQELSTKLEDVKQVAAREGVTMLIKTNTMNVTGNINISLQDINTGGNKSIG